MPRLRLTIALSWLNFLILVGCGPSPRDPDDLDCASLGDPSEMVAECYGECVALATHTDHCGSCGNACDPETANACVGGRCACVGANGNVSDECDAPTVCHDGSGLCIFPDYGTTETCDEIEGIPCDDPSKVCLLSWCTTPDCNHAEVCNGKDDDCDGHVDAVGPHPGDPEPLHQECYDGDPAEIGVGICRPGQRTCYFGNWTPAAPACPGQVLPVPEDGLLSCDGLDNDCNACVDDRYDDMGVQTCGQPDPIETDVTFIFDISGSMQDEIDEVKMAVDGVATTYMAASHIRWSIEKVDTPAASLVEVAHPLTGFAAFQTTLAGVNANGSTGTEPLRDAVWLTATGAFQGPGAGTLHATSGDIRPNAKPLYVVFGDEDGSQTLLGLTEAQVCQAVAARGAVLAVFIDPAYNSQWDDCAIIFPLTTDATTMQFQLETLFEMTCSM
jgi:hypothetical protein